MQAVRMKQTIKKNGELVITDLSFKAGQQVELTVFVPDDGKKRKNMLTARRLLDSGLCGLWQERTNLPDSAEYARELRERIQRRRK